MNKICILFLFFILINFSACDKNDQIDVTIQEGEWSLVWSDEFDGNSVDDNIWDISETPKGITSRTSRNKNLRVENGMLIMELHREDHNGKFFTGSEVSTRGFKLYGKFECRAKLPSASRAWPAFWLLGNFGEYGEWPKSGEVDIMEYWGYNAPQVFTNIHTQYSNWENNIDREEHSKSFTISNTGDEFHIYTLEWYSDHMIFLIDGERFWTYVKLDNSWEKWPFDKSMQVLFQLYAAPDWNGPDEDLPAQFEIDYIRVYDLIK